MLYGQNAAVGVGVGASLGKLDPGQPRDPALLMAASNIERHLTYADEAMAHVFQALSRLIPPVPTQVRIDSCDASDGTLLGALATLENRAARLAAALGEAAVQLDRAV